MILITLILKKPKILQIQTLMLQQMQVFVSFKLDRL